MRAKPKQIESPLEVEGALHLLKGTFNKSFLLQKLPIFSRTNVWFSLGSD